MSYIKQKDEEMETKTAPAEDEMKDDTEGDAKDEQDGEEAKEGEEDEDEEEESSDEEELPLGSVEAPVQIMTGKRDRKKTERLVMKEMPKTPEKKFEVPVGKGLKLGEIAQVAYQLDRTKAQDLKPLHKFLFGRIVKDLRDTKKNIRVFSGFDFDKEDKEYSKREALLVRFTVEGMKELCTILDVEKKGTKDKMMDRIMEFCLNPQSSGRPIPEKGRGKGKSKEKKKSKTKKKKTGDSARKKKASKGGGDASMISEDGDTTMEDGTGTEGDTEGDASMTEGESKPKKPKAKTTPKPKKEKSKPKTPKKKKIAVKTPTKKASPVKSPKKTPQKRKQDDIEDDSSDDEPLVKKAKKPPTDKELKGTIQKILEGANLEEVTMKMVCRKVYDTFPDFALNHKKDFIKATVREIIS